MVGSCAAAGSSTSSHLRFGDPCLTIGVPTYNRGSQLPEFLRRLEDAVSPVSDHVVINIADNCSTDGTEDICRSWASKPNAMRISYRRNARNLGAIANIVSLIERSDTEYFLFLGDDDFLIPGALQEIVRILHSVKPSAVLQAAWPNRSPGLAGTVAVDEALTYFYEFGNSWAGLMHARTARALLADRAFRHALLRIAWPQTALGYASMWHLQGQASPFLMDTEIGGPLPQGQRRIENAEYWVRSLEGLVQAARLVDAVRGDRRATTQFVQRRTIGFVSHLQAIARERALGGFVQVDCNALVTHLTADTRPRFFIWALIAHQICRGPLLRPAMILMLAQRKGLTPSQAAMDLRQRAKARADDIHAAESRGETLAVDGLDGERRNDDGTEV